MEKESRMVSKNLGGRREGAGRKPTGKLKKDKSVWMPKSHIDILKSFSAFLEQNETGSNRESFEFSNHLGKKQTVTFTIE